MWSCTVDGEPVAKGRPRVSVFRGRPRIRTPQRTAKWESMAANVLREAWSQEPLAGPVTVSVLVSMPRPLRLICSHVRTCSCSSLVKSGAATVHTGKPDLDNLIKAALDALVRAGVVEDDRQVVGIAATKHYAAVGATPGVTFAVTPMGLR